MNRLRELMRDRRRAQRGSVLSGVLIIVAFLAILAGALMTELSTTFLLSRTLMARVGNEATVNAAVELALSQMQNRGIGAGCPALPTVNLNGQSASATFLGCAPTVDSRSSPQFARYPTSASFNANSTHAVVPSPGGDEYLVGDQGGNFYRFGFGSTAPNWTVAMGGSVTGAPLAMPDGLTVFVPVANPTASGGCVGGSDCVALLSGGESSPECYMAAADVVSARPAAGRNFPTMAYFGDAAGSLYAYDTGGQSCTNREDMIPGTDAIVAGPVVFPGSKKSDDELYAVVSNSTSSQLVHYDFNNKKGLSLVQAIGLPTGQAVGLAYDQSSLPARLAISFADGTVALVQVQANFTPTLLGSARIPAGVAGAPFWCHCPGGDLIGVAQRGGLYVLNGNLNLVASYQAAGTALTASPAADVGGDWFVEGNDGRLRELQGAPTMSAVKTFGSGAFGQAAGELQIGDCGTSLCLYIASLNSDEFTVTLDARDAVITACITTSPPSCSGENPRLWATVEVGSATSPQTVHVSGWSYYSP